MVYKYRAMVGVGGIGTGVFFALRGNHTLGREESRSGYFIDRKDYCKLHIVSHYVKALLGPGFDVVPVGKVGDDEHGQRLIEEMAEAGLDISHVERSAGDKTLFSFCFVYPDRSGGNLTTDDSACDRVTPDYVRKAEKVFEKYRGEGIALAVPEVPLEARLELLNLGTRYRFFRAASFNSKEIPEEIVSEMLRKTDLLALNVDEAGQIARAEVEKHGRGAVGTLTEQELREEGDSEKRGSEPGGISEPVMHGRDDKRHKRSRRERHGRTGYSDPELVVRAAVSALLEINPALCISITAGKRGSWTWNGKDLTHVPAPDIEAVSTAGAGDAFLAGLITGLTAGLQLKHAQELAALAGAFSVTSPDTIHKELTRASLSNFLKMSSFSVSKETGAFL